MWKAPSLGKVLFAPSLSNRNVRICGNGRRSFCTPSELLYVQDITKLHYSVKQSSLKLMKKLQKSTKSENGKDFLEKTIQEIKEKRIPLNDDLIANFMYFGAKSKSQLVGDEMLKLMKEKQIEAFWVKKNSFMAIGTFYPDKLEQHWEEMIRGSSLDDSKEYLNTLLIPLCHSGDSQRAEVFLAKARQMGVVFEKKTYELFIRTLKGTEKAKDLLNEMIEKGIRPSAAFLSPLLQTFAEEGEESQVIQQFETAALSTPSTPSDPSSTASDPSTPSTVSDSSTRPNDVNLRLKNLSVSKDALDLYLEALLNTQNHLKIFSFLANFLLLERDVLPSPSLALQIFPLALQYQQGEFLWHFLRAYYQAGERFSFSCEEMTAYSLLILSEVKLSSLRSEGFFMYLFSYRTDWTSSQAWKIFSLIDHRHVSEFNLEQWLAFYSDLRNMGSRLMTDDEILSFLGLLKSLSLVIDPDSWRLIK